MVSNLHHHVVNALKMYHFTVNLSRSLPIASPFVLSRFFGRHVSRINRLQALGFAETRRISFVQVCAHVLSVHWRWYRKSILRLYCVRLAFRCVVRRPLLCAYSHHFSTFFDFCPWIDCTSFNQRHSCNSIDRCLPYRYYVQFPLASIRPNAS